MVVIPTNLPSPILEISLVDFVVADPLLASMDQSGGIVPIYEKVVEVVSSAVEESVVAPSRVVGP